MALFSEVVRWYVDENLTKAIINVSLLKEVIL